MDMVEHVTSLTFTPTLGTRFVLQKLIVTQITEKLRAFYELKVHYHVHENWNCFFARFWSPFEGRQ
jgi:hypothetical protein